MKNKSAFKDFSRPVDARGLEDEDLDSVYSEEEKKMLLEFDEWREENPNITILGSHFGRIHGRYGNDPRSVYLKILYSTKEE